ncbi:hypothetical protein J7J26_00050 [Candidatus Micrarchaeota archaeon]|nr:hypothetical protein [Candidatus Micrarchaeota archaeon]
MVDIIRLKNITDPLLNQKYIFGLAVVDIEGNSFINNIKDFNRIKELVNIYKISRDISEEVDKSSLSYLTTELDDKFFFIAEINKNNLLIIDTTVDKYQNLIRLMFKLLPELSKIIEA